MTKMKRLSKKVLSLITVACMIATIIVIPVSAEVADGAADLIYFNDFSDINTISFADRGAEKTTYGKIDTDTEGGHSSIYKHYMQTGTSRTTYMTSSFPFDKAVSGKKLGISFQLKYNVTELDTFQPIFYLKASHDTAVDAATLTDDTLFHIISGGYGYYYVGGANQQRYKFDGTTELKLQEWNRFDIEIDQTASPITGKVYANGTLCAEVTYPSGATFSSIEKLVMTSIAYDKTLENATSSWLVSQEPMIDNMKVYEIDENDTFGFVAQETDDNVIYAELGGTVSEIPVGITVKKVGTNVKTAINAELVKGHMIKFDLKGITFDAGAEYMIEVPDGMTDMYGRSFDDVLLFNAPAGESNIYYNELDSLDNIIGGTEDAGTAKNAAARIIEETISGYDNVLEIYSTNPYNNLTNTPYMHQTFPIGKTISSGKVSMSFDYMFNLPDDENPGTDHIFNFDVYPTYIDENGSMSHTAKPLFTFIYGSATDCILRSYKDDSGSAYVQYRPTIANYGITSDYHNVRFEIDKTTNSVMFYDNDVSITGATPYTLSTGMDGDFNALTFVMYTNLNNHSGNGKWNAGEDSYTTRLDNVRVWETASAMDLRILNVDDTEILPEAEIVNSIKGFKAYFETAATPVVTLKNNTDNKDVTVNVTPSADGKEHTIGLVDLLDAGDSYTLSVGTHKYNFTTEDSGMVISGFGIYNAAGTEIKDFSEVTVGETLTARANIYNGGGRDICISYGVYGSKIMKAFDFEQYEDVTGGIEGTTVEKEFTVTADMTADSICAYLWDDLNSLSPYVSCVEID